MKKIVFILLQFIFLTMVSEAADTVFAKYLPLAVGNKWVYLNGSSNGGPYTYWKTVSQISKDTVINNNKYFFANKLPFSGENVWIRYDSLNGHLVRFSPSEPYCNYERMYYDLSAYVGDSSVNISCTDINYHCTQIRDTFLFGVDSRSKTYYDSWPIHNGGGSNAANFAKNIGCFYAYHHAASVYHIYYYDVWLTGFIINGQLYGDTTLTFVNTISTYVPDKYSLSQNYPNPFNPVTKIKFSIPNDKQTTNNVQLIVYDVMGREVATLVNEVLQPGTYETIFDGSMLNSGVYFYKLSTGSFTETKRMLLLK